MSLTAELPAPASAKPLLRLNTQSMARGRVRLGTLSNLRWLAIVGQSIALLAVRIGFHPSEVWPHWYEG